MSGTLIENARVLEPRVGEIGRSLLTSEGRVAAIDPKPEAVPGDVKRVDAGGRRLTPGLIDMHTHGIGRMLYEQGGEALRAGLAKLPRHGVTCLAPTLYTTLGGEHTARLRELAGVVAEGELPVAAPGFHLEGPFLKLAGAGGLTLPGNVELLEELIAALDGRVAAMSISPDTDGILPVIKKLVEHGIAVFMTHTRAGVEQTQAAIDAGARHATHFYDVFVVPPEVYRGVRPVGAVETILADPRVSVDFIVDGVHVDPMAIRAALAGKGPGKVAAITDSYFGAGLEPGVYHTAGSYPVRVTADRGTRIHDPGGPKEDSLTGSNLTLDRGLTNLHRWLTLPEAELWAMATATPAGVLGLARKGTLQAGADADLVLWDGDAGAGTLTAARTWVGGRCVYDVYEAEQDDAGASAKAGAA